MTSLFVRAIVTASALTLAVPASAGETSGNGKPLPLNGTSWCVYSGINDTPEGLSIPDGNGGYIQIDPGGRVQSYGYFNAQFDFFGSPSDPDNRDGNFPGANCNGHLNPR